MRTWRRLTIPAAAVAALAAVLPAAAARGADPPEGDAWARIAPFFQPPAEFAGDLGPYRSPLLFDDGRPVRTAEDWARRRRELLAAWHGLMGPWPPLIEKPALECLETTPREGFTQRKVRLEAAPGVRLDGYLLIPPGEGPFPAALVVFYDAETGAGLNPAKISSAFGYGLTRRGFVSLSIGWPDVRAARAPAGLQPLSYLAYVAANAYRVLASMAEVDPRRVGVVGHSFGGKWALFAAALCEDFALAACSDPGIVFDEARPNVNYWEPWYLGLDPDRPRRPGVPTEANPRTGAYAKMVAAGRDLHELHALLAPRPMLVSGGSEDPPGRWRALNHAVAVNRLLGHTNRVAMTNRPGHGQTEESNEQLYRFFEHFLKRPGPAK